ncbi:hypothetical protein K7X08_033957 [Anisodus acutangulus]|uniref:Uncharacterized protein n=1 Tax=Anisodus acutangulus TaxID=402998 RepID=A0A9Q1RLA3_9SOLA|nr:hypothetical protein K7X08_033957 [Anisodus acutangulus]
MEELMKSLPGNYKYWKSITEVGRKVFDRNPQQYSCLVQSNFVEKYCVDFFRKGQEQEDSEQLQRHDTSNAEPRDEDGDVDASLLSDTKAAGLSGQVGTFERSEHQ